MNRITIYLAFCVGVFLESCRPVDKESVIVTWKGGATLEAVEWKVNDVPVGTGLVGYNNVFLRLQRLSNGAVVTVKFPGESWNENTEGFKGDDPFPFREYDKLRQEFDRLCIQKHLITRRIAE